MSRFCHLHVHTQYSILDGQSSIPLLLEKAKGDGMEALAITDHGSMFGVKDFHKSAKSAGIKPIIGCEVYVARNGMQEKSSPEDRSGHHLVLLAKNTTGYHNLLKLVSYSWTDGFYYKPRLDKDLLRRYSEGIIASSACIGGEVPALIIRGEQEKAEAVAAEFKEIFGEDYYLEMQFHPSGDPEIDREVYNNQIKANKGIKAISEKLDIPYIATNDVHFVNEDDAEAHDILICINTNADFDDNERMRYTRQEFLKTKVEMQALFTDYPEAIERVGDIVDKVEDYELDSDPVMPEFSLPEGFDDSDDYLRHITFEGAKDRWGEVSEEARERIDFELATIKNMGFPGYFLIVWDFLKAAREMGVSVGPGRGSAAGSAVAYCLRITDIDPIKYSLLFERFLNPDRVSMPDIDIDFDEDGREEILNWVVEKYGQKRVANIITFGTMAPKMAIRDVARVLKLPLDEADKLAKMIPEKPGTSFKKAYKEVPELAQIRDQSPNPLVQKTLNLAGKLEGAIRQTGVHACGIIIGRNDLEEHVPVSTSKEAKLYVTQYEGKHVEDVGMLKMDFLGLKTLSIIKDAADNVKKSQGIDLDIENLPLDDPDTYQLYSRGETTGLFQFESDGMKKYLRELKPNRFEDLIAMNALYRPGPMDYIPSFIKRKHGKEKIQYDLPEMEEYLADTYGITVYQEQVMLLSQKLAGFTKGQADSLRKAMGKKIQAMMDDLKEKFVEGAKSKGHDEKVIQKIWTDWEAFAQYAFNKSHSTCYAYVSYQTGYLKTHYPAEFMSAVLSRNINNIEKITLFMDECKRMGMSVLGPDVNESEYNFMVNQTGDIRFGLGGIKGVGSNAVQKIIEERTKNGPYQSIFDFIERLPLQTVNKKNIEALAVAGAFDNFPDIDRHQFFFEDDKGIAFIENLIRYGNKYQNDQNNTQQSLFGDTQDLAITKPQIPVGEEWNFMTRLKKEKDVIGIYLSAHPLDEYRFEIDSFCDKTLSAFHYPEQMKDREHIVAGIVAEVRHGTTKNGKPFGSLVLEDYTDSFRIMFFGQDYIDYRNYFISGQLLMITGKFQAKKWAKESTDLEFKVKKIELLPTVREERVDNIELQLSLNDINDHFINDIHQFSDGGNGKALLHFVIRDPDENLYVEMFSRSKKVEITNDFIHYLQKKPGLNYKVRKKKLQ